MLESRLFQRPTCRTSLQPGGSVLQEPVSGLLELPPKSKSGFYSLLTSTLADLFVPDPSQWSNCTQILILAGSMWPQKGSVQLGVTD